MATSPKVASILKYGTSNAIAPIDVYGNDRVTPVNLIVSTIDDSTIAALQNNLTNPNLSDSSKLVEGLVGLLAGQDAFKARDRIKESLGDSKGILSEIGNNALNGALEHMNVTSLGRDVINNVIGNKGSLTSEQIKAKYSNNIVVQLEGQVKKIAAGEFDNASEVVKVLGALTGTTDSLIFDIAAQHALAYDISQKANKLGLTNGPDAALAAIKPENQQQFLTDGVKSAALKGDLPFIKKSFEQIGLPALLAQEPNLYFLMLRNYRPDITLSPAESVIPVLEFLNQIDPKWYIVKTNGVECINVAVFDGIANDVVDGLAATPATQVICTIGYKLTGFEEEYRKRYK